jgi:hypothetical protein
MKDLNDSRLMWLKAWVFLLIGIVAFALLLLENPDLRNGLLLLTMIWAFCRAYYFAFYVIEHYVDDEFRFSGLIDFVKRRLLRERR